MGQRWSKVCARINWKYGHDNKSLIQRKVSNYSSDDDTSVQNFPLNLVPRFSPSRRRFTRMPRTRRRRRNRKANRRAKDKRTINLHAKALALLVSHARASRRNKPWSVIAVRRIQKVHCRREMAEKERGACPPQQTSPCRTKATAMKMHEASNTQD